MDVDTSATVKRGRAKSGQWMHATRSNGLNALDSYSHKGAVVVGGEYSNVLGAVVGGAE